MSIDLDALLTGPCHATWGETVYYYPGVGPRQTLYCPFSDKVAQTTFQDGDEVVAYRTIVNVRASVLAAPPVKGELFRARGVLYVVNTADPVDDAGDIRVYLGLASDIEAKRVPLPPS